MLWLALHVFDVMLHVVDVVLVSILKQFLAIYGKVSSKQARRQMSLLISHGGAH